MLVMDGHIVWALQVLSDCTIEYIHGNRAFSIPTLPYNPTLYTAYTRMSIRMYIAGMYVCTYVGNFAQACNHTGGKDTPN